MRRVIVWVLKAVFVRLVWNRALVRLRRRAAGMLSVRNLFGESVAAWLQMRKIK